jgi:hypothetical protein
MGSNPSLELDVAKYLSCLVAISRTQESVPVEFLEPKFDLVDAYLKLDKGDSILQEFESSNFEYLNFWKEIVASQLKSDNGDLSNFLNFYILLTFDQLVEALHESWHMRGIEDDWRHYDLICNYSYLDKVNKRSIKQHGADETFRRPCPHDCVCSKKSKAVGYCEQTS